MTLLNGRAPRSAVLSYAHVHRTFVIGAGGIALVSMALASGLMLTMRRG